MLINAKNGSNGGNTHSYDRCEAKSTTCKKCDLVGHKAQVRETLDALLRKKLYDANPNKFSQFFCIEKRQENAQNRLQHRSAKGRSGREATKQRGEDTKRRRGTIAVAAARPKSQETNIPGIKEEERGRYQGVQSKYIEYFPTPLTSTSITVTS